MKLWRRFRGWFERTFLGYVDPGVMVVEIDGEKVEISKDAYLLHILYPLKMTAANYPEPKIIKTPEGFESFTTGKPVPVDQDEEG